MAGLLVAPVKDGKIEQTASQASLAKSKEKKDADNKNIFLQLLVAEVKNQDPLEPASNTEWISQYATFSELEAMNSMSASFALSRASELVGKTVVINSTSDTGKVSTIQGKVDFVTYEGGQAYLSVNGSTYSMDDVYNVIDGEYLSAFDKVYEWSIKLNKLPAYENLTYDNAEEVEAVYGEYDKMSDYEKTFVAKENAEKIAKLHERILELKKVREEEAKKELEAEEANRFEEEQKEIEEKNKGLEEAEKAADQLVNGGKTEETTPTESEKVEETTPVATEKAEETSSVESEKTEGTVPTEGVTAE